MRTNVDFPKKVKNSFIFFQLGLIATMLAVLFILESNFESNPKKAIAPKFVPTIDFTVPTTFKIIPKDNPITENKPNTQQKFIDQIEKTEKEVPKEIVKPIEDTTTDTDEVKNTLKEPVSENPKKYTPSVEPEEVTPFNVEELPMFPACKGLKREDQMKCFEEQMAKAVAKNAMYPETDFDNKKQGVALISFVIDEKGKIVEVKAVDNKRATAEMQRAAERAVRQVSKLTPAKQGGKPVRIKYAIPVAFRIQ